ncbi:Transcription factor Dp-2 [Mortierella sp. AD094]|nr:Transcription factor Dp-2 [Mortierella sp. AD094]
MSMRSTDNRISPTTPRSVQVSVSILRSLASEPYQFSESPIDYRETNILRHSMFNSVHNKHIHEDHEMVPYSEQGNIDGLESEENDGYDESDTIHIKRQKMNSGETNPLTYGKSLPISKGTQNSYEQNADPSERFQVDDEGGEDVRVIDSKSTSNSRKQNVSESGLREDLPTKGKKGTKASSQKRGSRRTLSLGEALDQIEDEVQVGTAQSLAARGLRNYAQRVCERVQAKGSTSYIELVHELCGGTAGENASDVPETSAQENIRRRVYDALNVLEATGIISFDNKDIRWVGIDESPVIRDVPKRQDAQPLASSRLPGGGRDDESEEPEDDDMDIEQLEREIGAMRLRNELEQAKLQDQLTRQVQLVSLVKRNKHKEAKDGEREERRRLRKEEKRRARAVDEDSSMADVGPQCSSDHNEETRPKPERHRRRRSPRHTSERMECQEGEAGLNDLENDQAEDEEARRRRKKERRERRERKAQRRLENEQNRIQLPFVIMRMPGYTGQSSDSESNISVVRRVRRGQTPSQSNEHGEPTNLEATMVEIQIPQQEEPIIMSDTEILGDLGFNTLTIDELEVILPKEFIDAVQYTVDNEERQQSPCGQQRVLSSDMSMCRGGDDSVMTGSDAIGATSVTIQGGFEREFVRAASEGHSAVAE